MRFLDVNTTMQIGIEPDAIRNLGEKKKFVRYFFLHLIFVEFIIL